MRPSTVQSLYLRRLKLLSREPGAMAQFGFSPSYAATQPVVLPKPVVITLEQLASATAWRAADERKGLKADVERDIQNIEFHSRDLMEQMYELGFSQETVKNIIQICHLGGWRAANERAGYKNDVKKDQKQLDDIAKAIAATGQLDPALISLIRALAETFGWHAANSRKGYDKDAKKDKEKAFMLLQQMCA